MVQSKYKRPEKGVDLTLVDLKFKHLKLWLGCSQLDIKDNTGRFLMRRFYLANLNGWRLMLHQWKEGDDLARGFHDHPWHHAWTAVLRGSYADATPLDNGKTLFKERRALSVHYMDPKTVHAAVWPKANTLTLFLTSPRVRSNFNFYKFMQGSAGTPILVSEPFDPSKHSEPARQGTPHKHISISTRIRS